MWLYTAPWCEPCKELKQWLADKSIKYKEICVEEIGREEAKSRGVQQVPTLFTFDNSKYSGREEIKPFIERRLNV